MAQVTSSHTVKFDSVFDRPLDSIYNEGGIDTYRMCEWGIMKRAVEAECDGLRGRKIVALGASMSKFAIVVASDSDIYEPEMLKDKLIAVTPNNGSHFVTLKMIEGFLTPEHVKTTNAGTMPKRIEALRAGKVAAVSLMEPWISVAQKMGLRILIESHSTRSEAAGDDLDGPTLKKMFQAQARAVKEIERDPTPYVHYFIRETGGLLEPHEFQTWRLLHAARLERLAAQLPASFVRTHRSAIANLAHVERLERDGASWRLFMSEGAPLPVSRARLAALRDALDQAALPLRATG
jgi:NitT/TauT family transport system substrate-binding protein